MNDAARPRSGPPALDPAEVIETRGSSYPEPFRAAAAGRAKRALGDALGLANFGVNLVTVEPGSASSQRHWHRRQDEFVYVLEGELVLVTEAGEQVLEPGMAAGFPAAVADGHQLVNRGPRRAVYIEVGDRLPGDALIYPDIDLAGQPGPDNFVFTHKDGTPY